MRFNLRHVVPFLLLSMGCGVETPVTESQPLEAELGVQQQTMFQAAGCTHCLLGTGANFLDGFERKKILGDVYQYSIRLQVGPDAAHDIITLHRVVRERAAWVPVTAKDSAFLVHGDVWNFQAAFMASTLPGSTLPADHSIAVYLAQQGVDVWGIDLRWTHVEPETQDFSFMKGWNLGLHAKDVGTGLTVARAMRLLTGSGGEPMNLLGWSRGAAVSYAYLNQESQVPASLRNVSGFIPVDMAVKFNPNEAAEQRNWACVRAQLGEMVLQQGRYEGNLSGPGAGIAIGQVGQAAVAWPNVVAAPPLPPLTYQQLGVTLGAATHALLTNDEYGIKPPVPFYHFTAGVFGASGVTGLQYVTSQQLFTLLGAARPFQSITEVVEGDQMLCGQKNLPYDDHLKDVKVPVMYVGAAGGYGSYGEYGVKTLLGSRDVTIHKVQRQPAAGRATDYGHVDLFLASDAKAAVWAPIREWIRRH